MPTNLAQQGAVRGDHQRAAAAEHLELGDRAFFGLTAQQMADDTLLCQQRAAAVLRAHRPLWCNGHVERTEPDVRRWVLCPAAGAWTLTGFSGFYCTTHAAQRLRAFPRTTAGDLDWSVREVTNRD